MAMGKHWRNFPHHMKVIQYRNYHKEHTHKKKRKYMLITYPLVGKHRWFV